MESIIANLIAENKILDDKINNTRDKVDKYHEKFDEDDKQQIYLNKAQFQVKFFSFF